MTRPLDYRRIDINVIRDRKEKFIPEEKAAFADRSVQWLSTYKVPLTNREGVCNRVLTVSTDITYLQEAEEEKKALQKRLIAVQKMEAVGTLAGGIAHDFNNILMGIQGSISLLLYDLKPDHPHRQKLENIENNIQRGADLTKKLLGFARGGKYDVKPTNINELLGNSADLFGRTRKEVGIYRSFEKNSGPWKSIGDRWSRFFSISSSMPPKRCREGGIWILKRKMSSSAGRI